MPRDLREPTESLQREHTEVDASEVGTQAASPKALADAASGSHGQTESGAAKPTAWATASNQRTSPTTAAQALDKSDLARSRMFHIFGVMAPLGALVMSLLIGGDPYARVAFWIGACVISVCNMGLVYLTSSEERYNANWIGVLWVLSTIGVPAAVYYFGPFSAGGWVGVR